MKSIGDRGVLHFHNLFEFVTGINLKNIYNKNFQVCEKYEFKFKSEYLHLDEIEEFRYLIYCQNLLIQVFVINKEIGKISTKLITFTTSLYFIAGLIRLLIIYGYI